MFLSCLIVVQVTDALTGKPSLEWKRKRFLFLLVSSRAPFTDLCPLPLPLSLRCFGATEALHQLEKFGGGSWDGQCVSHGNTSKGHSQV